MGNILALWLVVETLQACLIQSSPLKEIVMSWPRTPGRQLDSWDECGCPPTMACLLVSSQPPWPSVTKPLACSQVDGGPGTSLGAPCPAQPYSFHIPQALLHPLPHALAQPLVTTNQNELISMPPLHQKRPCIRSLFMRRNCNGQ